MVRARIRLGDVIVAEDGTLTDKLDRSQLRVARQREGRHLLRRNPSAEDPELIWRCSLQLCQVGEAFRTQKGAPGLVRDSTATRSGWEPACSSPSWPAASGGVGEVATLQLLDVPVPTTDGHELLLVRRTESDRDLALLLARLGCQGLPSTTYIVLAFQWRKSGQSHPVAPPPGNKALALRRNTCR